ncbi:histidinol-phosphate transaminase [Streptomyces sp. HUCO-GS316]|uniref:histidinol-phosphate transaminase n=1 Tax=Streptomyces sp. HUCO-GS316 TaxID=2692198 RepID=UPI0013711A83|nr:histidinol-phosphate transaminase [Streptomyces sp. HUCO-GS316]MXM64471.1 histidinol-phosphate transaminase [Streptomyces sp. HUCO-GS316]
MVRVRSSLEELPAYVPGRKLPGAAALASNESPYGLLPGVAGRLAELAGGVSRYPDMGAGSLVRAIAGHHGVDPERIAVGAGSSEVCGQLLHAVVGPGDEAVFGWRSFEAYPILTAVAGGTAVKVPLRDHGLDLDAMAAAITDRTRLVFVCNPNNPTSTAVGERALLDFADRVPENVLLVVDEAYREYADPALVPDALGLLGDRPNVVVLRTFSKAYGLAGLRVGYCVAQAEIAAAVRKTQVPFSVSALAQEAAVVALGERAEVARRAALTVAERERVTATLRELGFEVPGSQANFVWLPLGDDSAPFARHCLDGKVVVRPFPREGVRVTIGLPEENDAFLALAAAWRG